MEPMILLDINENKKTKLPSLNAQGSIGIASFSPCDDIILAGNNKGGVAIIKIDGLKVNSENFLLNFHN